MSRDINVTSTEMQHKLFGVILKEAADSDPENKALIIKAISDNLSENCSLIGISVGEISDGYHTFNELYRFIQGLYDGHSSKEDNEAIKRIIGRI